MKKLLITVPCWHNLAFGDCLKTAWDIGRTIKIDQEFHPVPNNADRYRAICCTFFLKRRDFTHWLTIDADMGVKATVIQAMLDFEEPFVLAPGPYRDSQELAACGRVRAPERGLFQQIEFAGLCCALIRRDVTDALLKHHPNHHTFHENGDEIKMVNWFDRLTLAETGDVLEPDHAFLQRCKEIGFPIWAHTNAQMTHV